MERFSELKNKGLQLAQDFSKRFLPRGIGPSYLWALGVVLLTITLIHQSARIDQLENDASELKSINSLSKRELPRLFVSKTDVVAGAIYTRWGRTTCPSGLSKLVYKENDPKQSSHDFYELRLKEEAIRLRPWNSDEALFRRRRHVMQTNKGDLLADDSTSLDHKIDITPDITVPLVRQVQDRHY